MMKLVAGPVEEALGKSRRQPMAKMRSACILMIIVCGVACGVAVSANAEPADRAELAATAFEKGDYRAAYKQYLKQAKNGDPFAQYRISYMELMGMGTSPDVVEAMAWAVLAAESGHEDLKRYQDTVATLVPGKQRKKAQARADYYVRRWGPEDRAGGGTLARQSEGVCTGSRLAGNCGQGDGSAAVWIAWGDDRSDDPEQKDRIEELNRSILEHAADISDHAGDS